MHNVILLAFKCFRDHPYLAIFSHQNCSYTYTQTRVFNIAELLQYTPKLCNAVAPTLCNVVAIYSYTPPTLLLFSHLAFYGDVFLCGILSCLMVDDGSHLVVQ